MAQNNVTIAYKTSNKLSGLLQQPRNKTHDKINGTGIYKIKVITARVFTLVKLPVHSRPDLTFAQKEQ
jgi:hypothetical protein